MTHPINVDVQINQSQIDINLNLPHYPYYYLPETQQRLYNLITEFAQCNIYPHYIGLPNTRIDPFAISHDLTPAANLFHILLALGVKI